MGTTCNLQTWPVLLSAGVLGSQQGGQEAICAQNVSHAVYRAFLILYLNPSIHAER